MKIGIIADVHANLEKLGRALALLGDLGADEIVCAGDLVGSGSDNGAAHVINQQQIPCVQGNSDRGYRRDLPLSLRFEWAERRVLLAHASPWDQTTYVRPNSSAEPFHRIAAEADADYVILGHTHIPMAIEVGGVWVFNPGSVDGNRFEPYASTCALLELSPLRYRVFDIDTSKPTLYTFNRINPDQHANDGHTHIELG
jgi:putative phosphoesterase